MEESTVRLNKYISESGFTSRREADRLIEQGRVRINGKRALVGTLVAEGDEVTIDGERIGRKGKRLYIAFNKPAGVTCTTDTSDRSNIVDYINHPERIFHIGRLDKPSEGLIFLTNDGDIVNKILRAGNNHEKEYVVTVNKPITTEFARRMSTGVRILGTVTLPCRFIREDETRFRMILTQGLNRQIRRMCEALDYKVVSLRRVRIMKITLKGLNVGEWRYFTDKEVEEINRMISLSSGTEEASLESPKKASTPRTMSSNTHSRKPKLDSGQRPHRSTQTDRNTRSASGRETEGGTKRPQRESDRQASGGKQQSSRNGSPRDNKKNSNREYSKGKQKNR